MPRRHEPVTGKRNVTGTSAGDPTSTGVGQVSATAAGTGALRGLVGAGPSQVGIVGALRARDVSRPTPDDIKRALAKPEPTARPGARQDTAPQDAAESGTGGGTSVSS
ncbi:MAG TPA: hypothetical protein VII50_08950 [Acidothermaceae bacterium]